MTIDDLFIKFPDLKHNIIFLDIDGVFNCESFYEKSYKEAKKELKKLVKKNLIDSQTYYLEQICSERVALFSELCKKIGADVVISSTWRKNKTIQQLQDIFNASGGTFRIIGKTPITGYERGTEISLWIKTFINEKNYGISYRNFKTYAIIDDDDDMLLNQTKHFFQTDQFDGLTSSVCSNILDFFTFNNYEIN